MRIRHSSIKTLHRGFANAAESWADLSPDLLAYAYRHGIAHFLCIPEAERAQGLIRHFEYALARLDRMGGEEARAIRDDHIVVEKHTDFCEAFAHQANFYRSQAHVLAKSDAEWPPATLLVQLALDHGDNSPLTQAANAWSAQNASPNILRLEQRPKRLQLEPLIKVITGALGMGDHLPLPGEKLLIWERGAPHRREPQSASIWCLKTDDIIGTIEGHPSWILGAEMMGETHVLSWSAGRVLITSLENPDESTDLKVDGKISGVKRLDDRRLLCWGSNGVSLWDLATHTSLGNWLEEETVSTVDVFKDTLLIGTRFGFRDDSSGCFHRISLGGDPPLSTPVLDEWAKGGIQLSDSTALCWAKNFMFVWNQETGSFDELPHDTDVGGAIHLSNGTLFSWQTGPLNRGVQVDPEYAEQTIGILWSPTGERLATLRGHGHWITNAMEPSAGRLLTHSRDGTSILWDPSGAVLKSFDGELTQAPSGNYYCPSAKRLAIWKPDLSEALAVYPAGPTYCEVGADLLLTWESEGLKVWDTSDKWQGYIYQPDDSERHETNVDKLMLTDNRLLTHSTSWGTEDNVARVWDLESCTCVEKMVHPDSLRLVKHLDNDLLMTAARDNRIRWWDWRTGEVKHEANAAALRIQTLEDGTLVTECPLGFRTWTEEGEEVSSFMPGGNVKFSGPLPVGGGQALVVVRPGGWKEASSQIYRWSYLTEDAPVLLAESEPKVLSLNRVDGHPVTHDARGEVTIWAPDGTQALRRFQTMERGLRWLKVVGHTLIGADYLNMSCWNVNGDLLWTREEEHGLIENIQELTPGVIAKWCVWKSQWPDESSREQLPLDPDIELFDPANGQTLRRLKGSLGPLSKLTLLESGFVLCRLVTEGVYYEWKNKFNLWSPSDELVASGVSLTEMAQTHPSALRSYLKQESSQNNEVLAHTFASYRFSDHEFNVNPCAVEVWEGANGALLGPIEKSKTHPSTLRRLRWYSNNPCSLIRVTPDGSAIIMHEGALKRLITHP